MKSHLQFIFLISVVSLLALSGCRSQNAKYDYNHKKKNRRQSDLFQYAQGDQFFDMKGGGSTKPKNNFNLPQKRKAVPTSRRQAVVKDDFVIPKRLAPVKRRSVAVAPKPKVQNINLSKKDIQGMLRTLGFYNGPIDGLFGKKTGTAIRNFQKRHDLKVDGVAGNATKKALMDEAWGSRSSDISIQMMLRQLGYYSGPIDGVAGKLTKSAVKDFQRKNGLKVDGVAGKNTKAMLRRKAGRVI